MRPFTRTSVAAEVDDELAFHLEMRRRDLEARGLADDAARAEAARRFGIDTAPNRRAKATKRVILGSDALKVEKEVTLTITGS